MKATSPLRRLAVAATAALLSVGACTSAPDTTPTPTATKGEAPCDAAPTEPAGQCVPELPTLAEVPASFDCTQPAPVVPCCKALLPRCTACVDRNREIDAAWRTTCEADAANPATSAPATVPADPPITTP
jgi:hypothetical protein